MNQEPSDGTRELTDAELDQVSGGGLSPIFYFAGIASGMVGHANSDAQQAADHQRELSDRQAALRRLASSF
jgi:bacteriocin-like protein